MVLSGTVKGNNIGVKQKMYLDLLTDVLSKL